MGRKVYVGNLPLFATGKDLQKLFSAAGTCESARVLCDRNTGRSRGFGFVEMKWKSEAEAAIRWFNGYDFRGRTLRVMEARAWRDRQIRGVEMPIGLSSDGGAQIPVRVRSAKARGAWPNDVPRSPHLAIGRKSGDGPIPALK